MPFSPDEKPQLQDQKFWKELPRDPVELLLLARIGGGCTVRELSISCARTLDETMQILDRLVRAGILASPASDRPDANSAPDRSDANSAPADDFLVDPRFLKRLNEIDTRVLAEEVDLEPRRKEEILLLYHSLSTLTPFQLFGIRRDATDRDIKRAYQRLSMRFHPDRYYGKNLGSFKPMMESIFRLISQTFTMLSSEENRKKLAAVYPDAGESDPEKKTGSTPAKTGTRPEAAAPPEPPAPPSGGHAFGRAASTPDPIDSSPRKPRHRVGLRSQIASILARTESNSIVSEESSGSGESEGKNESIILPPPGGYKTPPERLGAHSLLHRMAAEKLQRIQTHLTEGKRAFTSQNYGTAASHFKLVLSLDPQHEEAARLYKEAESKKREELGNSYAARACMEDEMGDYEKAAELWELAVENLPEINNLMAAASAFMKIRNYTKARQYAQQAVEISGKPEPFILLAQVYLAAGMALRAQSTLRALLEKYPRHPAASRLLREAEKLAKSD